MGFSSAVVGFGFFFYLWGGGGGPARGGGGGGGFWGRAGGDERLVGCPVWPLWVSGLSRPGSPGPCAMRLPRLVEPPSCFGRAAIAFWSSAHSQATIAFQMFSNLGLVMRSLFGMGKPRVLQGLSSLAVRLFFRRNRALGGSLGHVPDLVAVLQPLWASLSNNLPVPAR